MLYLFRSKTKHLSVHFTIIFYLYSLLQLQMTAIDQSRLSCNLTITNAMRNKVDNRLKVFQRKLEDNGEIADFEINHVDVIISNPPYLFSSEIPQLPPEIKL